MASSTQGSPSVLDLLQQGAARASARRTDILKVWLLSFALALPLAIAMRTALLNSLGPTDAGTRMLSGWDGLWFRTWEAQATGFEESFGPGIVGIGAVFKGLDAMVSLGFSSLPGAVIVAAVAYALLWVLLSGGLITRYGSGGGRAPGLLAAGAAHTPRLAVLAALAAVAYAVVFAGLLPFLWSVQKDAMLDVNDERVAVAYSAGKYGVVWLAAWAIGLVHDYAKIASVRHPQWSAGRSIAAAVSLIRRHGVAVVGCSIGMFVIFIAMVGAYWVVAPGVAQGNPFQIFIAFLIGQASIVARIGVRAWGYATRVALVEAAGGEDVA